MAVRAWVWARVWRRACSLSAALLPGLARAQDIPLIRDTEVEDIVHRDGEAMWRAAGLDPKTVHIVIVGDPELNAFTAGGQTIFVNVGLIEQTKTPNQLIGVLAHETGHITGGHVARDTGGKPALATYLLTMGLGILAAAWSAEAS